MHLELTAAQASALRELLDGVLSDLNMEISHTDNPRFRDALRARREDLRAVQTALAADPVAT